MDLSILSQMWDAGDKHYFANELSRLKNNDYVIPIRWLEREYPNGQKTYHADAYRVEVDTNVSDLWFRLFVDLLIYQ